MVPREVLWDWSVSGNRWSKKPDKCPCVVTLVGDGSCWPGKDYRTIYHPDWNGNRVTQTGIDDKYIGHYWNVTKESISELKKLKPYAMKEVNVLIDDRERVFP